MSSTDKIDGNKRPHPSSPSSPTPRSSGVSVSHQPTLETFASDIHAIKTELRSVKDVVRQLSCSNLSSHQQAGLKNVNHQLDVLEGWASGVVEEKIMKSILDRILDKTMDNPDKKERSKVARTLEKLSM